MSTAPITNLFGPLTGPAHHLGFGPLEVVVRRNKQDWSVGFRRDPSREDRWFREDKLPPEMDDAAFTWKRFAVNPKTEQLQIGPRFPARPVVIRPAAPYAIIPGEKVQFFMSVSLALRITTNESKPVSLLDETARSLSQTWFGEPTEGELCFASRTRAQRDAADLDIRPYRVICPVRMKNISDEILQFERFCLRGQYLNLYQGDRHFWSNEIGVTYKGPSEVSRVVYHPKAPEFEATMILRAGAEKTDAEYFNLRSFYNEVVSL